LRFRKPTTLMLKMLRRKSGKRPLGTTSSLQKHMFRTTTKIVEPL
jgi:hypothetical protein